MAMKKIYAGPATGVYAPKAFAKAMCKMSSNGATLAEFTGETATYYPLGAETKIQYTSSKSGVIVIVRSKRDEDVGLVELAIREESRDIMREMVQWN